LSGCGNAAPINLWTGQLCCRAATDLANSFFRRAGEALRPSWEALGRELEELVSAEEMAALARSTQYANCVPEGYREPRRFLPLSGCSSRP
jgi:hypothetical protein